MVGGAVVDIYQGKTPRDYDIIVFSQEEFDRLFSFGGRFIDGYINRIEYFGYDIFIEDDTNREKFPQFSDIDIASFCYSEEKLSFLLGSFDSLEKNGFRYVQNTWKKEERIKKYLSKGYTLLEDTTI